ncbi:MAG: ABC transporter permease subunit [Firmicutes bacterium]|nr:ABC transporter permease subunit [Bacillota bacterium]
MNKLIGAGIMRIKSNKAFWIGMIFMAIMGIVVPIARDRNDDLGIADQCMFAYAVFLPVMMAIFCSLFLGTEYSDGTIRNKIVVGHTRVSVYLTNLLLCLLVGLVLTVVNLLLFGITAAILGLGLRMAVHWLAIMVVGVFLMTAVYTALYVLAGMLIQNKAVTAIVCTVGVFLMLVAGTYISNRLEEPEFYTGYSMSVNGQVQEGEPEPNPNYLDGAKRQVYEFLFDFLPGGQTLQYAQVYGNGVPWMMVYDGLIVIVTTGIGIFCFRRKDLK